MKQTIRMKIKQQYRTMSPKEKLIADYFTNNGTDLSRKSISDISLELGIADSTLFQFTKKIGYAGFRDFKIALITEESDLSSTLHENITKDDNLSTMISKVFDSAHQTIQDTKKMIDLDEYKKAVDILNQSERLYLFGVGGSNAIAMDAYHKFLRSSVKPVYTTDSHMQLMNASLASEKDCAIIICHTGLTTDITNIASLLTENNTKIISITSYPVSPLVDLSDAVLTTYSEETNFRSESLASRISQLTIIDSLFVCLSFINQDSSISSLKRIRHAISLTKGSL